MQSFRRSENTMVLYIYIYIHTYINENFHFTLFLPVINLHFAWATFNL